MYSIFMEVDNSLINSNASSKYLKETADKDD
jgi:hypothetical protein